MNKNYFITITGLNHYYGMKPIEIGRILKLVKDRDNEHDEEAIAAVLPYIGVVGYVANSPNTVARGTHSAGRVYDVFEDEAYAQVLFATRDSVICLLILPEEMEEGDSQEANIPKNYKEGKKVESRAEFERKDLQMGFLA